MTKPVWISLLAGGYLLFLLLNHRFRIWRAKRAGLPPARLSGFDHRSLLDELQELYEAGLPEDVGEGARIEVSRAELGVCVAWLRVDFWEAKGLVVRSEALRNARDRVRDGHDAQVGEFSEPGQPAAVDQQFASLGIHFFVRRLYAGDLVGADRLLRHLSGWTNGRISPRIVDKHRAQIAFLQAESQRNSGGNDSYKHAARARKLLRRAGATQSYAEPGARALWAHTVLVYFTHPLNLEFALFRTDRLLRRGLSENNNSPLLFYELAHACAHRGRTDEAVDHLARALYFSNGARFYLRPVLEVPEIARIKPALVAQVRAQFPDGAGGVQPN